MSTHDSHGSFLSNVSHYFDRTAAPTGHPNDLLKQIKI